VVLVAIKKRGPPRRARILSKTLTGVETAAVARKVLKHGAARASRGYPLGRRWPRPVTACPKRDWRKAVLDKTDAVGLQLGVEDFGSFATEALTDHPQDKKADIIYIDEAEGLACIAQGYMGKDWGKTEAKANKASDLNTAVAWLFQTPINDVPPAISEIHRLKAVALVTGCKPCSGQRPAK